MCQKLLNTSQGFPLAPLIYKIVSIATLIVGMNKLNSRENELHAQDHIASKEIMQDLNPDSLLFIHTCVVSTFPGFLG